jgi:hypothetical protein
MIVTGSTLSDIRQSARLIGVSIHNIRKDDGTKHRFVIRADPEQNGRYSVYRASKKGERRRLGDSVCRHGHIDFIRDLLGRCPNARIKTTYVKYEGLDHFERKQKEGDGKAGVGQLCDCDESE